MFLYETIERYTPQVVLAHPLKTRAIAGRRPATQTELEKARRIVGRWITAFVQKLDLRSIEPANHAPEMWGRPR